jgi:dihydrofolate reductase
MDQMTTSEIQNGSFQLSLLVAADENNVIGKDNQLPWHLPSDLKYFKNQTWGMPVLMGRKTFESIGKPLTGRKNIVITRNRNIKIKDITIVHSIHEAVQRAKEEGAKEIFVIGGGEVFRDAFTMADRIYLTRIHHQFDGDTFFPEIDAAHWQLVRSYFHPSDEKNWYAHTFGLWERKHVADQTRFNHS